MIDMIIFHAKIEFRLFFSGQKKGHDRYGKKKSFGTAARGTPGRGVESILGKDQVISLQEMDIFRNANTLRY